MQDDEYGPGAMWWFGPEPWGSPVCKTCKRVPIPVGEPCLMSGKIISDQDRGLVLVYDLLERRPILLDMFLWSVGVGPRPAYFEPDSPGPAS